MISDTKKELNRARIFRRIAGRKVEFINQRTKPGGAFLHRAPNRTWFLVPHGDNAHYLLDWQISKAVWGWIELKFARN